MVKFTVWVLCEDDETTDQLNDLQRKDHSLSVINQHTLRRILGTGRETFSEFLTLLEEEISKNPPNWVVIEHTDPVDNKMSRSVAKALYTPPSYRNNVVILFQKPLSEKTKKDYENLGINKFFDLQTGGDIMTLLE